MEINGDLDSEKEDEYYDNLYDVYLNESNQYNIYIENDLDPKKMMSFMKTCMIHIKITATTMVSITKMFFSAKF